jgi:hypothetical protein
MKSAPEFVTFTAATHARVRWLRLSPGMPQATKDESPVSGAF